MLSSFILVELEKLRNLLKLDANILHITMEPESDDEEQINPNTFIVLDSQRPPMLEEGENQAAREREAECHEAILKNLEISRASCPETPAHLQGSEARQKCQVGVIFQWLYSKPFPISQL